jgi:hypothetical protein
MYTQNIGFGSGVMFGTPSSPANATPVRLGVMQEGSIDFTFSTKELFGQKTFPVAIGRGTSKVAGKAKFARIDAGALHKLFFGMDATTGQIITADAEAGAVPGSGAAIVTVNHSAAFEKDLGVNYATTGQPMAKVASSPAAGQYSVSAGVYTFSTSDYGAAVLISYAWTDTVGTKMVITNPQLGTAIPFQVDFYQSNPNSTQQWGVRLYSCVSAKLSLATKLEDFTIPDFEFQAFANAADQIGVINLPVS